MSHNQADDAEYMADEYDMEVVDEDMDEELRARDMVASDSDVDEYDYLNNKMADTSAAQARKGKDMQGIPWERLSITRDKYRENRLEQYKNYENVQHSGESSVKECKITKKGGMYYEFRRNSRSVKSTILHFQLRNLVWATSKHDVYLMSHYSVTHWSSLTCDKTEVLNVSGHVAPCEKHPGSLLEGFTQTQVSTLAVKDRLLVAGGFQGELICKTFSSMDNKSEDPPATQSTENQDQDKLYDDRVRTCKVCKREFMCGKGLAGHMKKHLNRNKGDYIIKIDKTSKAQHLESLRENPSCQICGKGFFSMKALFGHMKSHPERDYRGIQPPQTGQSSSSSTVNAKTAKHQCNICLEIFASGQALGEHMGGHWVA